MSEEKSIDGILLKLCRKCLRRNCVGDCYACKVPNRAKQEIGKMVLDKINPSDELDIVQYSTIIKIVKGLFEVKEWKRRKA